MAEGFNFDKVRKALENELKELPKELAVMVKDDAISNVNTTSFNGKKWAERKQSYDHPMLNDTGNLLSAIRDSVQSGTKSGFDTYEIRVVNDYGLFHNEGTPKMAQRQFIGEYPELNTKLEKYIIKQLEDLWKI